MSRRARIRAFLVDLRRRRVYRALAVYLAAGFVFIEAADLLLPALPISNPDAVYRVLVVLTAAGLPVALVLSWAFHITGEGIQRDTGPSRVRLERATADVEASESNRPPSVLVLPLEDLSPDGGAAYLCDSLADEIITDLVAIHVPVISRSSALQLHGTAKDPATLRSELGVQYLLEGTIHKEETSLRINVRLVDCGTGHRIWARKFRGETGEVFRIQETISRNVLDALPLEVELADERLLAKPRIEDTRAYEYYLRARHEIFKFSGEALVQGERYLERALEITEENVTILSAMGYLQWQFVNVGADPDPSRLDRAESYARRILELEADSKHAHRILGLVAVHRGEAATAIAELDAALEVDPNDSDALMWQSILLSLRGEVERAGPLVDRLLWIDPLPAIHQGLRGFLGVMEGDFERGASGYRKALDMEPGNPILALGYGQALAMAGRLDEACAVLGRLGEASDSFFGAIALFLKRALQQKPEEALGGLGAELRAAAAGDPQMAWTVAQGFSLLGDEAETMAFLRHAAACGMTNRRLLARLDPLLERARASPEYGSFLELLPGQAT